MHGNACGRRRRLGYEALYGEQAYKGYPKPLRCVSYRSRLGEKDPVPSVARDRRSAERAFSLWMVDELQ